MVETLAEPTEETLMEATVAATVATRAGPGLPEIIPLTSGVTLLRLTTGVLKMTEADTKRPIGASPSASLAALKRPSPTVTSSNSSALLLPRNAALVLQR